mmetsp:Transcript_60919/g.104960  ORF Transcript_60919/g.104960 Transcript_60919/m.104960 type:complete len:84 (-) Transcript_60919:731-982(-)
MQRMITAQLESGEMLIPPRSLYKHSTKCPSWEQTGIVPLHAFARSVTSAQTKSGGVISCSMNRVSSVCFSNFPSSTLETILYL